MPLVSRQKGGFSLLRLFGVVSDPFHYVLVFYAMFLFVPLCTNATIIECFVLQIYCKSASCRFYYKEGQALLSSGTASIYPK